MKKTKLAYYIILMLLISVAMVVNAQIPAKSDLTWQKINALSDDFTTLDYTGGGVYSSTNFTGGSPTWTFYNPSSSWHGGSSRTDGVTALALNGSYLYAGTSQAQGANGGLFISSSGGAWQRYAQTQYLPPLNTSSTIILPGPSSFVTAIAYSGSKIYLGLEGGVDYSSNNGSTWTNIMPSSTNWDVTALAVSGSNLFVGTYGTNDGGVNIYNGSSWSTVSGLSNTFVTSLAIISGTSLVAGTDGGGVFYSSNSGSTWSSINGTGLTNLRIASLIVDGSTIIAGTNAGVFYTTNTGTSWTAINTGLSNLYITSLAVISSGSSIVAATNGGGVFYCTNYASSPSWSDISGTGGSSPLPSKSISSLVYDNTNSKLYVGVCPKWRVMDVYQGDCCGNVDPNDVAITYDATISSNVVDLTMGTTTYYYSNSFDNGTIETYFAKYGYGYYEMSAKPPYTASSTSDKFHPDFWNYYDVTDASSSCTKNHQEIDIFEPGGNEYIGKQIGCGLWFETGSCGTNRTVFDLYNTYPSLGDYLYNGYNKYALEWSKDKMIWYFNDVPFYTVYNDSHFPIEGLQQLQFGAGLDNGTVAYATGDGSPPYHYKIDYFNYYRLNYDCSNSITVSNNSSTLTNSIHLTGTYPFIPAVYSGITISPSSGLSLSTGDNNVYRAVNSITIQPTGSGSFDVQSGQTLVLQPTPCGN